jgi:hypothetical protein
VADAAGVIAEAIHARHCSALAGECWGPSPEDRSDAESALAALREAGFTVSLPDQGGPSFAEFAVAFGGDDPNDCAGRLEYDDSAEAAEMTQWIDGGYVARRTVTCSRWERVEGVPF